MENLESSKTLGQKFDSAKARMSLLPKGILQKVVNVLELGAKKYQEDNWQHVTNAHTRYYDAMQRHIEAWWSGEIRDPETGEHHLAHATCCAMFLMWFDDKYGVADRVVCEGELPETITPSTKKTGFEGVYEHVDGGQYRLLEIANQDSVDEVKLPKTAIYRNVATNELFARPLKDFKEKFTRM